MDVYVKVQILKIQYCIYDFNGKNHNAACKCHNVSR